MTFILDTLLANNLRIDTVEFAQINFRIGEGMKYITIYDMGVNQVHSSETFNINRPRGLKCWLFLVVKSRAVFVLNGEETIVEPNTAIFFKPHAAQIYHGLKGKENYCDHWMEFDMEENVIENMGIPMSTPITGFDAKKIDALFSLLLDEHYFGGKKKDLYIQLFMQAILEKISESVYQVVQKNDGFQQLHQQIRIHPENDWNVEDAAKQLNFSKSHFQTVYRSLFGISFRNDVIKCRITRARTLLEETNMPVTQIAAVCGYHSDNYFVRQFKQITGMTPAQYRRNKK